MQQTDKYKLNLIEPDDPFLPDGLNVNTRKIEEAMSAHEAKVDGEVAAIGTTLNAAVKNLGSGGKNARIAWGTYQGTGQYGSNHPNRLALDFFPVVLILEPTYDHVPAIVHRPMQSFGGDDLYTSVDVIWADRGVSWYHLTSAMYQRNEAYTYHYVVLGYDLNS